jgi:uncharacterized membrane protein YgcG
VVWLGWDVERPAVFLGIVQGFMACVALPVSVWTATFHARLALRELGPTRGARLVCAPLLGHAAVMLLWSAPYVAGKQTHLAWTVATTLLSFRVCARCTLNAITGSEFALAADVSPSGGRGALRIELDPLVLAGALGVAAQAFAPARVAAMTGGASEAWSVDALSLALGAAFVLNNLWDLLRPWTPVPSAERGSVRAEERRIKAQQLAELAAMSGNGGSGRNGKRRSPSRRNGKRGKRDGGGRSSGRSKSPVGGRSASRTRTRKTTAKKKRR